MPKKETDQKEFRIRFIINNIKEFFVNDFFNPFCQTRYKDIPIKIYSIVQTGPNIQLGGLKNGLTRSAYQELIPVTVAVEPMTPATKDIKIATANFIYLFFI